jgi:hypothetical protein
MVVIPAAELTDRRHVATVDDDLGRALPAGDAALGRVARKSEKVPVLHVELARPRRLLRLGERGVERLLELRLHAVGVGSFLGRREAMLSTSLVTSTLALAVRLSTPLRRRRVGARRKGGGEGERGGEAATGKAVGVVIGEGLVKCGSIRGCNSTSEAPGSGCKAAQNRDCYK